MYRGDKIKCQEHFSMNQQLISWYTLRKKGTNAVTGGTISKGPNMNI